jgi:hypothetical protein
MLISAKTAAYCLKICDFESSGIPKHYSALTRGYYNVSLALVLHAVSLQDKTVKWPEAQHFFQFFCREWLIGVWKSLPLGLTCIWTYGTIRYGFGPGL